MRRILVIITNPRQASYRLRIDALRPMLASRGFDLDPQIRPRNFLARRSFLRAARDYDAVILQRKLLDPADARLRAWSVSVTRCVTALMISRWHRRGCRFH